MQGNGACTYRGRKQQGLNRDFAGKHGSNTSPAMQSLSTNYWTIRSAFTQHSVAALTCWKLMPPKQREGVFGRL
eukprot:1241349-Rhodomonas_salina.3